MPRRKNQEARAASREEWLEISLGIGLWTKSRKIL